MKAFGFYCSAECRQASLQNAPVDTAAAEERAKSDRRFQQAQKAVKILGLALLALMLLGVAWLLWIFVVHPTGKLIWQWDREQAQGELAILRQDEKQLTVRAGNSIVFLSTANGKVIKELKLKELPVPEKPKTAAKVRNDDDDDDFADLAAGHTAIVPLGDGYLAHNRRAVAFYQADGTQTMVRDAGENFYSVTLPSPDGKVLYCTQEDPLPPMPKIDICYMDDRPLPLTPEQKALQEEYRKKMEARRQTMLCLELPGGKELWSMRQDKGVHISEAVLTDSTLIFLATWAREDTERPKANDWDSRMLYQRILCGVNRETGKMAWRVKDVDQGISGLRRAPNGMILFTTTQRVKVEGAAAAASSEAGEDGDDEESAAAATGKKAKARYTSELILHAIHPDGTEKYTLNLKQKYPGEIIDSVMLVSANDTITGYDLDTGKELWAVTFEDVETLALSPTTIFITGLKGSGASKRKPQDDKMPSIDDVQDMKQLAQAAKNAGGPDIPYLHAFDRQTGKELWNARAVYGQLLADAKRIVTVADTAKTSILEATTGGKGETLMKQFNPRNGKLYYVRNHEIGFRNPKLTGNLLVGVMFERRQTSSAMHGNVVHTTPAKLLGVAAWRVK